METNNFITPSIEEQQEVISLKPDLSSFTLN
jgi:hypothetical protein